MNIQFTFETSKPLAQPDTYQKDGKKYLRAALWGPNFEIVSNFTTLLIPNDNSGFVSNFKKEPNNSTDYFFSTPTSNLTFFPNFHKIVAGDGSSGWIHGLAIKDNSKITKNKRGEVERLQKITFKVIGEKKNQSGENYSHELTIEPLDLGIENLPAITHLTFNFYHLEPGRKRHPDMKGLEETWLYNHKILTESVGKSFNMKVNRFSIGLRGENQQLDYLNFGTVGEQGDFDLDSFRQINIDNNNPNQPTNNPPPSNNGNSNTSNGNKGLIIGATIIFASLALIIGFLRVKKRKK